jgi:hypothetical protein
MKKRRIPPPWHQVVGDFSGLWQTIQDDLPDLAPKLKGVSGATGVL